MDELKDVGLIIGLILSSFAVLGVIYGVVLWRSKVDQVLSFCKTCSESTPKALVVIQTKMDLVWQLQTAEVMERQKLGVHMDFQEVGNPFSFPLHDKGLAEAHSPYRLTERGEDCLKDVLFIFDDLKGIEGMTPSDVPVFVTERIGKSNVASIARQNGVTPAELMAAITIKMGFGL